jgi:hypothetical protein
MAYTGTVVELPLAWKGLTGTKNLTGVDAGYLTEATNVSFDTGTLRKEGGAAKYNSSAISGAPTILGGFDHSTNALAQRMIVATSDGKLYKDTGAGTFATTLKTGLSGAMRPYFVEGGKEAAAGNRKLFVFTGTDVVQVLADDAATTANIALPPADWSGANQPTFGFIHAGRLFAAGNANDPHRVYISSATNHEDFTTTTITFGIAPGEGEAIVGGMSFQGYAVLWKRPRGIYVINTADPVIANWTVRRVTRAVGGISPWAIVETEEDIIFVDATGGIQSLRTVQNYGDIEPQNLSQISLIEPLLREKFSLSRLNQIRGVYYVARRELHFAFTSTTSTVNDSRLVLDSYYPGTIRYRISPRDVCESMWLRRDANGIQRIMVGDNAGFVRQIDQPLKNKDGMAYKSVATTVPTDLGFAGPEIADRVKNLEFLELVYEPTSFNAVVVKINTDNLHTQTIPFFLQSSGATIGITFILGTAVLGGAGYVSVRKRLTGGGKFMSFTFENSNVNEDFSIARARLSFTLGNS